MKGDNQNEKETRNVYQNLENILIKLKEKYKLAIVSNCADGYIEAFLNSSGLAKYFDDYLPAGKYRLEKGEAIRHGGTLITKEEIDFGDDTCIDLEQEPVLFVGMNQVSFEQFENGEIELKEGMEMA